MYPDQHNRSALLRPHRLWLSRLGWALFAQMAAMLAVQMLVGFLVFRLSPALLHDPAFRWCLSVGSAYGVGVPAFCLALRGMPVPRVRPVRPMGPLNLGKAYVTALGLVYLANFLTLMLTRLIGALRGAGVTNPVDNLAAYPIVLNLLLGCVIAPVSEEFLFRKLLLDRLRPYGDRFAILASALCFGLFHGNLNQFFYAFAVGAILAYEVLRTGCLWQSILIHALVNFTSVGLVPLLNLLGQTGQHIITLLVLGSMGAAVAFLAAGRRKVCLAPGIVPLPERWKWRLFFLNPGVLFFLLLALLLTVSYLV